jgi:hypothetical protein
MFSHEASFVGRRCGVAYCVSYRLRLTPCTVKSRLTRPEQTAFEALTGLTGNCRRVEIPRAQVTNLVALGEYLTLGGYLRYLRCGRTAESTSPLSPQPIHHPSSSLSLSAILSTYTFTLVATTLGTPEYHLSSRQSYHIRPDRVRSPSHLHHLLNLFVAAPLSFRYPLSSRCWTPRTTSTTSCKLVSDSTASLASDI